MVAPQHCLFAYVRCLTSGLAWQFDKTIIKIAYRFVRAKTPEQRAHVDLDTHYTQVIKILTLRGSFESGGWG